MLGESEFGLSDIGLGLLDEFLVIISLLGKLEFGLLEIGLSLC